MLRWAERQEGLALQAEQGHILHGLHDTVKQEIHAASMMIEAAIAAQKKGDSDAVRDILERALEASREAGRDLSRPFDELRVRRRKCGDIVPRTARQARRPLRYGGPRGLAAATLAGADGYLHKGVEGDRLLEAIQRTHAGERVWLLPIKEEAAAHLRETSEARLHELCLIVLLAPSC